MEPDLLPIKQPRSFRSEAEYRKWQRELHAQSHPPQPGTGLVSRIADRVRDWASQDDDTPRKQQADRRAANQRA